MSRSFADLIFRFMSGEPAERLQQRFCAALQAVDTINDLCTQPLVLPALLEEGRLNTVFLLMLSRDLPPLALAQCLARARFGYWSNDLRTFFSDFRRSGQGLSIKWGITTRDSHDLGTVCITFSGDHIVSFRFMQAWPTSQFRPGLHVMDSRFSLPAVDNPDGRW